MRTIGSTLWLRKASVSVQIVNEINLCVEESWAVRTRNQGMVVTLTDMAVLFLSFLSSSVVAFLLISQTFASRLITSRYLSLSCTRYSRQLGAIPKDFVETFSVSLKRFFWPPWERLPWNSSPKSSFFGRWWSFKETTWPAQRSCDWIKMV